MTDTLTQFGIEADDRDELLTDLRDGDAEEVGESEHSVVFALDTDEQLDVWAGKLNVERAELADRMRELADGATDYNWGTYEPFVVRK